MEFWDTHRILSPDPLPSRDPQRRARRFLNIVFGRFQNWSAAPFSIAPPLRNR